MHTIFAEIFHSWHHASKFCFELCLTLLVYSWSASWHQRPYRHLCFIRSSVDAYLTWFYLIDGGGATTADKSRGGSISIYINPDLCLIRLLRESLIRHPNSKRIHLRLSTGQRRTQVNCSCSLVNNKIAAHIRVWCHNGVLQGVIITISGA